MRNVSTTNISNYNGYINTSFDASSLFSDRPDDQTITLYDIFTRLPVKSIFVEHVGDNMPHFVQEIRDGIKSNVYGDFVCLKFNEVSMICIAFIRFGDNTSNKGTDIYWSLYYNDENRGWDTYWHLINRIDIYG